MNKGMIAVIGLMISSPFAFAGEAKTYVSCRDRAGVADAGYLVRIEKDEVRGVRRAILSAQSIMGPRDVGTSLVELVRTDSKLTYVARGLNLKIDLNNQLGPKSFAAKLNANIEGDRIQASLSCRLVDEVAKLEPVQPDFGRVTCMAYWIGYRFDVSTMSCVQDSASGCSSPFPFDMNERAACDDGYKLQVLFTAQ